MSSLRELISRWFVIGTIGTVALIALVVYFLAFRYDVPLY